MGAADARQRELERAFDTEIDVASMEVEPPRVPPCTEIGSSSLREWGQYPGDLENMTIGPPRNGFLSRSVTLKRVHRQNKFQILQLCHTIESMLLTSNRSPRDASHWSPTCNIVLIRDYLHGVLDDVGMDVRVLDHPARHVCAWNCLKPAWC